MSLMWIPAQTTMPPLAVAARADGTSAPTGAKMIAASSGSGGVSSDEPAQSAPRERANAWPCSSPARVKAKTLPSLVLRDLGDDVRGGAEAVQSEPLGVARHPQRAVADQARAEQRRGLEILVALGNGEAEPLVRDDALGVAAVQLVPGEAGPVAQVLAPGAAVAAGAVRPAEPGDADAGARREALSTALDRADDLVPDDERAASDRGARRRRRAGRSGRPRRHARG